MAIVIKTHFITFEFNFKDAAENVCYNNGK